MKIGSTVLRMLTAGVLFTLAGFVSAQQNYPSKSIRLVVPNPPSGSPDVLARIVGQRLTDKWGQQVVIENRPGANAMVGTQFVARANPDGYTILLVNSTHIINSVLVAKLPFDAIADFAPIATLTSAPFLMIVNPALPVNNLREFIALAKSNPGKLNFATSGDGSVSHLTAERFKTMAGVKMERIPYKGAGQALTDLMGGQVEVYFASPISSSPHIKSGKLKPIAISGETRLSVLPQVPTFSEAGLPDCCGENWFGVLAPAGTPKAIIDRMAAEINAALILPSTKATLATEGVEPLISTPEQFLALMKSDKARIAEIVKAANIKLEN